MSKRKEQYPHTYGDPLANTLMNMVTPLSVDNEGDMLVPPNDMKAVAGKIGDPNFISPDPIGYLKPFGDGTKS